MRIDVWGPLRITGATGLIGPRDFPGIKPKQLLEVLVAERGHTISKSRLTELLWAGEPPRNAAATLETYVSMMRHTLQPGVRARDSVVITEPGGYRLDETRTTLDLAEFDRLVRAAGGLPPVEALNSLQAALSLVRGQVLEDEPDSDWADALRSAYRHKQVGVLIDAGRLALGTGEPATARSLAEQAVLLEPLAEAAYQVLMTASYALWRQEDALRAFNSCRTLLADELGVAPMDDTLALHLAILRHEDSAMLLPMQPARPASGSAVSAPGPVGGLIGRTAEIEQLAAATARARTGHFTISLVVGESGIGKTRLVEALVDRAGLPTGLNRCSDLERGLPYVALSLALRGVLTTDPQQSLPIVTDLLERRDRSEPFDQFARVRIMESLAVAVDTHTPFLLVLDDVQWADAESLAAISYLRRRCPQAPVSVVLTTTSEAAIGPATRQLGVDQRIDLSALSEADLATIGNGAYDATGGHPMFLADWLEVQRRGLAEPCTPALREWVLRQCWDLGPQAYRLLTVGSLLEEPFSPSLLAGLVGAPDEVDELELWVGGRWLVPDATGTAFHFRRPLVRQILAGTFSAPRRAQLLRQAHDLQQGARNDDLVGADSGS